MKKWSTLSMDEKVDYLKGELAKIQKAQDLCDEVLPLIWTWLTKIQKEMEKRK